MADGLSGLLHATADTYRCHAIQSVMCVQSVGYVCIVQYTTCTSMCAGWRQACHNQQGRMAVGHCPGAQDSVGPRGKVGGGWTYLDISGCHSRCGVALLQRAVRLSWHHVHVELGRLSARSHLAGTGGAWATMQMCLCPAMTQAQRSVGWLQLCKWQLELL